jgi:hypothetical protein
VRNVSEHFQYYDQARSKNVDQTRTFKIELPTKAAMEESFLKASNMEHLGLQAVHSIQSNGHVTKESAGSILASFLNKMTKLQFETGKRILELADEMKSLQMKFDLITDQRNVYYNMLTDFQNQSNRAAEAELQAEADKKARMKEWEEAQKQQEPENAPVDPEAEEASNEAEKQEAPKKRGRPKAE